MRGRGLFRVGKLPAVGLRPADNPLLVRDGQRPPSIEIVNIALGRDVASPRKLGIVFSDQGRLSPFFPLGIFRAVDESDGIARIEIAVPVNHLGDYDLGREDRFEAQDQLHIEIVPVGCDVDPEIASRGRRDALATLDGFERPETLGALTR